MENKMKKNSKPMQNRIRARLADTVDISKDIILDTFLIRGTGNNEIIIENYKGILEYTENCVRIKAKPRCIKICGNSLELCNISDDMLCITGNMDKISFTKNQDGDDE